MTVGFSVSNFNSYTAPAKSNFPNRPDYAGADIPARDTEDTTESYFKPVSLKTTGLTMPTIPFSINPLPEQRALPDIMPLERFENTPRDTAEISLSSDGKQMRCYVSDGTTEKQVAIRLPDGNGRADLSECFEAALRGETTEVTIGGLYFTVAYDVEAGRFSFTNDDAAYYLPFGLSASEAARSETPRFITIQNAGNEQKNLSPNSVITTISQHPDESTESILTYLLEGDLKGVGKDVALNILNNVYAELRNNLLARIVLGQELAAVVYDLIYALETLYYKDKLAGDKEEFRADTEGIGVTGKARKLMEIQMARQTEIDKLTEISYGEPQTKLLHTKLLNKFVIKTFVEEIFLPDLFNKYPDLKDSMFMFGFGRLLSEYNKLGASAGSDVDSNIIVDFTKTGAVLCENEAVAKILEEELGYVQIVFKEYFNMDFEIDEYFTVRTFAEFEDAISSGDPATNKNLQFYLSIQKDYYRFSAPTGPLESAFLEHIEATRKMHGQTPVQAIFEETLNDSGKYSIGIIHGAVKTETDAKRQLTIAGGKKVREVIGSGKEEPDNWYFSMKYTVNRFYDFLYKLESLKGTEYEVGLADVGLTPDDVLFIKNANNMMLVLQNYAYTRHPEDCSYLSAEDFQELYVQADFPQGLKYLYIGDGLLLPDNFQTAFNIAVEKTEIFLNPLTKGVVGITKKYKELGHEFFQKLDKKMWEIHQKIAKSDALKN